MHWRLRRADYEQRKGAANRNAMRRLVARADVAPGVLAYLGLEPVGWCAVAPRDSYVRLERSRVLQPIDAHPVWSIVCLFVAAAHRRHGISVALVEGAAAFAEANGATIVEGYPLEPGREVPAVFAWTGTAAAFRAAGVHEVARRSAGRPIMRRAIREGGDGAREVGGAQFPASARPRPDRPP